MVEMKNKRLNVAASVSGRGDCRGGYKWKRRLPASSFGAVMRTTAGGGDRVADQILNNTCEDIIYNLCYADLSYGMFDEATTPQVEVV